MASESEVLSQEQVRFFTTHGYLVAENFFDLADIEAALQGVDDCFDGKFNAGVAPELLRDDIVGGQVVNRVLEWGWKADYRIANLVLSRKLGQALTQLNQTNGARLKQDALIWKGPGSSSVNYHQDSAYKSTIPGDATTVGIVLTECTEEIGCLEYVPGSHNWAMHEVTEEEVLKFQDLTGDSHYRQSVRFVAEQDGMELTDDDFVKVTAQPGAVIFHHGQMWHGSSPNSTFDQHRKILFLFTLSDEDRFPEQSSGEYNVQLVRRYKDPGSTEMPEAHFPILWRNDGYQTPWIEDYIANMTRQSE